MSKSETLRAAEKARFAEMLGEISPLEGAHDLLVDLARRGYEIILASSSPEEYLDRYLDLLAARDLVDAATTAKDVEATKPEPDIIESAKAKAHLQPLVMVGDSPWDIESADRAGMLMHLVADGWLLRAGTPRSRRGSRLRIADRPARRHRHRVSRGRARLLSARQPRARWSGPLDQFLHRSDEAFQPRPRSTVLAPMTASTRTMMIMTSSQPRRVSRSDLAARPGWTSLDERDLPCGRRVRNTRELRIVPVRTWRRP